MQAHETRSDDKSTPPFQNNPENSTQTDSNISNATARPPRLRGKREENITGENCTENFEWVGQETTTERHPIMRTDSVTGRLVSILMRPPISQRANPDIEIKLYIVVAG
ncbi:hypothetical protein BaRGS_00037567 [Batillaria attramentaria]|uniref:Uncharacterized protein n=1 Tax=Batillaria attramentaria TaxID=370345 RepID=A0ABD0J8J1_9CAEN